MAENTIDKIINTELLAAFKGQTDARYVQQEFVSGSSTRKKQLTDNNFTDADKQKLDAAGESDFSGSYNDLTNKPSIGGATLSGSMDAAGLGLATPSDVSAAQAQALKDAKAYTDGKGYQTAAQVDSAVKTATADMATQSWTKAQGYDTATSVNSKVSQAKSDMQAAIDAALTSAVTPKGSCAFSALPAPSKATLGNMWNVTDAFTTTDVFTEGAGKGYGAGSNVVCVAVGSAYKWDVQGGFVDLSGYLKTTDVTLATVEDIKAIFES